MADTRRQTVRSAPAFLLDPLVGRLGQDLPPAAFLYLGTLIDLPRLIGLFVLEFVVALQASGRERARFDGPANRATGFLTMAAIAEPALVCDEFKIGKRPAHRLDRVPQLQLSHAWRVDKNARLRQHDELTHSARVTAAIVPLTHLARSQQIMPDQPIHNRGLPDARGPKERRS